MSYRRYSGDGVYVEWEDGRLRLTTEDGFRCTNVIILEPDVLAALLQYAAPVLGPLK